MSDLVKIKNNIIADSFKGNTVKGVMLICRAISPQFYKNLSSDDMATEKMSIELLTGHIDNEVMMKMCELAVQNYGTARSDNNKTYFDINYILTFYRSAFNSIWCHDVHLPLSAKRIDDEYDPTTRVITEFWEDKEKEIIIKYIVDDEYNSKMKEINYTPRHYTPASMNRDEKVNDKHNEVFRF